VSDVRVWRECGLQHDEVSNERNGWQTVTRTCARPSGHSDACDWEWCGEGATGDPFCDVECQRLRGHAGPHRFEWGSE
jgi:hypothetical protein